MQSFDAAPGSAAWELEFDEHSGFLYSAQLWEVGCIGAYIP